MVFGRKKILYSFPLSLFHYPFSLLPFTFYFLPLTFYFIPTFVSFISYSNLIIHLVGKYQLHQHKGVCYRQVATHPMTACLGGANVLRKQELRLC